MTKPGTNEEGVQFITPEGLPAPRGFAHGTVASGRLLSVAGQIGCDAAGAVVSDDFAEQFARALDNVLAVVRAAGGAPGHVVSMTVFVTDVGAYRSSTRAVGEAWRARLGRHFPAMALLGVSELVEPRAKVEITATAVLP